MGEMYGNGLQPEISSPFSMSTSSLEYQPHGPEQIQKLHETPIYGQRFLSIGLNMVSHTVDYIASQINEIRALYGYLFPNNIRLIIMQGDEPYWGSPRVVSHALHPSDIEGQLLHVEETRRRENSPSFSIIVRIPPESLPNHNSSPDVWGPRTILHRVAVQRFPTMFEHLKYRIERRKLSQSREFHRWKKIRIARNFSNFTPIQENKEKPSIVIAMHWLEMGGAEKFAFDCINIAVNAGFRVFIVADKLAEQSRRTLFEGMPDIKFLRTDRYLRNEDWPLFLEKLVRAENVKALHIHHCSSAYSALAHLRITCPSLRIMDTTHILEYNDGGYPRMSGVWSRFIDHHHVISANLAKFYNNEFATNRNVVLGRLIERRCESLSFRMITEKNPLQLIFVGRLIHQKRPFLLIDIMKRLLKTYPTAKLKVVGDGPYKAAFEDLVLRNGFSDIITIYAPGSPVKKLMQSSDILILPSANEGLALVCYEAIENGVIPISSNVGAQSELLPDACLTNPEPYRCVRETVDIIQNLVRNAEFLEKTKYELTMKYNIISNDPTGSEVVENLYHSILVDENA